MKLLKGYLMQKTNQRLGSFISEFTAGEILPLPLSESDKELTDRIWSGTIAQIDEGTYQAYLNEMGSPARLKDEDWFVFSDARTTAQPGVLFWQRGMDYFARGLDQDQWEKLLRVAKVKKNYW
jgi:hypothetical protein